MEEIPDGFTLRFPDGREEAKTFAEWRALLSEEAITYHCTCELEGLPPCWRLIDDPVGTLLDKARWPVRVCFEVARTLTDRWLSRDFLRTETLPLDVWRAGTLHPLDALRYMYPLPIGAQALLRDAWAREYAGLSGHDAQRQARFLPFDDEVYAALILTADFPRAKVTFFGTAHPGQGDVYLLADALFVVRGPRPDDPQARQFIAACRAWWRTFQGKTLHDLSRAGRPPGSAHVGSVAEFADRIFPIIRNLVTAGERPTQAAVCERITATWPEYRDGRTTCAERQLRRWFAPYWADWETVVQAAMSSETD